MMFHRVIWGVGLAACSLAANVASFSHAAAQAPSFATQAALDTNNSLPTTNTLGAPMPEIGSGGVTPTVAPGAAAPTGTGAGAPMGVDTTPPAGRPKTAARNGFEPRGNPLWAISLKSLTATRERPILLPSRRPPAPPAVAGPPPPPPPAPPPAPPQRPQVSLVGAVAGEIEGIAIFLEPSTRNLIRVRTGENLSGWTLRSVRGREAILQKDRETIHFALPAPSEQTAAAGLAGLAGLPGGAPGVPGVPGQKEPQL